MRWFRATGLRLLLAVGLSFALWIFVSFSENPDQSASFDGVPVTVQGLSPGLVLVDTNGLPRSSLPPANITVQADAQTLARNVQSNDIRAYIDLDSVGAGEHVVSVVADAERSDLKGLTFSNIVPSNVSIRLEQLISTTIPITVEVRGNLPFSFERGDPKVTNGLDTITQTRVLGPQGRVAQVRSARAVADIEQIRADYTSSVALQALDESGNVVQGVTLTPNDVSVSVPIRSVAGLRRVAVLGQITGYPAAGYVVRTVTSDPQLVNLTGSSGPLDAVNEVQTEPIDISNATGTISREVNLLVPIGTSLQVGERSRVTVVIEIVPLTRPFSIQLAVPVQVTNIGAGLSSSLVAPTIQVQLSGSDAALARLGNTPLQALADLAGRGAGTHTITPKLALPDGIQVVGAIPNVTVTLRALPTATVPPTRTSEVVPTQNVVAPVETGSATTSPVPNITPEPTAPPGPTAAPAPNVSETPAPGATPAPTQQRSETPFLPPDVSPTATSAVIQ